MRKFALLISIPLLFFPFLANAAVCMIHTTDDANNSLIGYPDGTNANGSFFAMPITPVSTCTVSNVGIQSGTRGAGGGTTMVAVFYSNVSSAPGVSLATSTAFSGISSVKTWATSTISYTLNASTNYWLVIYNSAAADSGSEYRWYGTGTNTGTGLWNISNAWDSNVGGNTKNLDYEIDGTIATAASSFGYYSAQWW